MAEVVVAYADADATRAEALIQAICNTKLAAASYPPGPPTERSGAEAVVVVWSAASAEDKRIGKIIEKEPRRHLVFVLFDRTPLPKKVWKRDCVDLVHWRPTDQADRNFQLLALVLINLARSLQQASLVELDGKTPPIVKAAPGLTGFWGRVQNIGFLAAITGSIILTDFQFLLGAWVSALINIPTILAIAVAWPFATAESAMSAKDKALFAIWLRPKHGGKPQFGANALLYIFKAIFGEKHISMRCVVASVAVSLLLSGFLVLLLLGWGRVSEIFFESPSLDFSKIGDKPYYTENLERNAGLVLASILILNLFVDYFSLWKTRRLLELSADRLWPISSIIIDLFVTVALLFLVLLAGPALATLFVGGFTAGGWSDAYNVAGTFWRFVSSLFQSGFWLELSDVSNGDANVSTTTTTIAFLTTFAPSLWLLLVLMSTPILRFVSWVNWGGDGKLTRIGKFFNVRSHPIAAVGYVSAILVFLIAIGVTAWIEAAGSDAARRDCADCPEMITISAGANSIGSSIDEPGRDPNEGPASLVEFASFDIGAREVTFRSWDACSADGFCQSNSRPDDEGWGRGSRPVINISWDDIAGPRGYLDWLNREASKAGCVYRLPSESEWEYAARGGESTPYWWGEQADPSRENYDFGSAAGWSLQKTTPAGGEPNPFGLRGVHGNVAEWVQDCWNDSLRGLPDDGSALESGDCDRRVVRGGAWSASEDRIRAAARRTEDRSHKDSSIGFRVVCEKR